MNQAETNRPHRDPMLAQRMRLGARLRESRQASDLSRAEVARATCIPLRTIALLESGEFNELPAEVFVRGFLRCYAERVGLDPEATLRAYDTCQEAPLRCGGKPGRRKRRARRGGRLHWARRAAAALASNRVTIALSALAVLALGMLVLRRLTSGGW